MDGGTQQPWGFPTQNDHFGVEIGGYHHLRKHPFEEDFLFDYIIFFNGVETHQLDEFCH